MYKLIITYNKYKTIDIIGTKKRKYNSINECINYINKFRLNHFITITKIEIIKE